MAGRRLRVAVIRGGTSSERPVSLRSGRAVANSLDPRRFSVSLFDPKTDLARLAKAAGRLDVALILLHGRPGEDGTIQGMLDLLGVPYQCAGVLGCALAMNKVAAKERYRAAGLAVAPDVVLRRGERGPAARVLRELGLPAVVKPNHEGSSFGVTIVKKKSALMPAIKAAFELDSAVLVERYLNGRELTCGVLGNRELVPLPLVEIIPGEAFEFFDYTAKYVPGATSEVCPAPVDRSVVEAVQDMAMAAQRALFITGYSRSDFILTDEGPVILETNTIPGMTRTSLLPQAAAAAGISFSALAERLIELALEKGVGG